MSTKVIATILCIHLVLLTSCALNSKLKNNKKGVFVRLVNIDSTKTEGYMVCNKRYPGLKPYDTSKYQFMKVYDWTCGITVYQKGDTIRESVLHDCRTCFIDSPRYITIRVKTIKYDNWSDVLAEW